VFRPCVSFRAIDDGGEGAGYHDPFDGGCVRLYGFEDPCGAIDGWVEKVLFRVCDVKVKGGGGMDYGLETVNLEGLIKGAFLGDVGDDLEG
jgi:hypothetical protein